MDNETTDENVEFRNLSSAAITKELKLVVAGDGYIGKTCLLWSFIYRKFPIGYVPTVFDIHAG